MPELPEVETTRRGIEPHIKQHTIANMVIRQHQLRWPIPAELPKILKGLTILAVRRRAKYLLLDVAKGNTLKGTVIIHLGMSGSLRLIHEPTAEPLKHEHFDITFTDGQVLRYTDPRRFGACVWQALNSPSSLLDHLGPEPLSDAFNLDYLYEKSRGRNMAIKTFIMDQKVVVGVGNIYASEALFMSGINPKKAAGKISKAKYQQLINAITLVLDKAIQEGGTTLKDFVGSDGKPGYFAQQLNVYGRNGLPCIACKKPIVQFTQAQRSTFYCPSCQK